VQIPAADPEVDKRAALTTRLAEMRKVYDGHLERLTASKSTLTRNLSTARAQHRALESSPPKFDEQGSRYDTFGNRIGASGVRTSQSDREREMKKYNEQLAQVTALIAVAEAELVKVEAEEKALDRSYDDAVAAAKADAAR
jgi:hypothetical protein